MNDPKRDELYKRIGAHVAKLRRQLGWTQERLAEEVGIDASYLARVESGTRRATLQIFRGIADALDQDLSELFDEDRKSTRLNSSHVRISYAVFCLKKKKKTNK